MKQNLKKTLPMGHLRSLLGENDSVSDENRTIELTWTTGSKGLRIGWEGSYYEELSMKSEHVDLKRLQSGAPLLASHDSQSLNSVIGVVERAWLEGDQGKALVRFSKDPEADRIFQKVKERVLRNVSVGYAVRKYEDVSEKGDKIPTFRATNWEPMEISIVPIGFDPSAQVRSADENTEVEIELNEIEAEPVSQINEEPSAQILKKDYQMDIAEKLALEAAAKKQAALEEKQRSTEIRRSVRAAKLEDSVADELINKDATVDEARKQIIDMLATRQPEPTQNVVRVDVGNDNSTKLREGFEESLLNTIDSKNFSLTEGAKPFYGRSLISKVELILPRHLMESDATYAKRAMSSSDLPLALANVAEKGLQKIYDLQPRTFQSWTSARTLRNYKEYSQIKSGDFASLVERSENEDFTQAAFGEKNEVAQLKDYGIIHAFSSQMLVNDDLSVIQRLASSAGIAVSRKENQLAYAALLTNKTMKNGNALYSAGNLNLGTTGAINATTVGEAYKLMRKQLSADGADPLNLTPKFLVCGPDKEVEARQFLTSIIPNQTSNVNIFQGSMQVIVDAQITGNQFYFLADPSVIDTVVCFRLEGKESPKIESRVKWENNALELKVDHTFAAAPMDHRGMVKNVGA